MVKIFVAAKTDLLIGNVLQSLAQEGKVLSLQHQKGVIAVQYNFSNGAFAGTRVRAGGRQSQAYR